MSSPNQAVVAGKLPYYILNLVEFFFFFYHDIHILRPPCSVRPCPLLLLVVRGGHYHPRVVGREYVYVGRSSEAGARAKIIWDRSAGGAAAAYIIGAWKFRGMSG